MSGLAIVLTVSHTPPPAPKKPLETVLRDYLKTNDYVVPHITKPVKTAHIPLLIGQSAQPIVVEKPGFRLTGILVKHRPLRVRALGVPQ